jgi:hypothetical protein
MKMISDCCGEQILDHFKNEKYESAYCSKCDKPCQFHETEEVNNWGNRNDNVKTCSLENREPRKLVYYQECKGLCWKPQPAEEKRCGFCGTINDAHHSAECVDTNKGATLKQKQEKPSEPQGWEREFDEKFVVPDTVCECVCFWDEATPKDIKSFIRSLINSLITEQIVQDTIWANGEFKEYEFRFRQMKQAYELIIAEYKKKLEKKP